MKEVAKENHRGGEEVQPYAVRETLFYWIARLEDRYNREFLTAIRPKRITVSSWRALSVVSELGGLTVGELAEHVHIDRSVLSRLLIQLEKDGMIKRVPRATDRRTIELFITDKGRKEYESLYPIRKAVFERARNEIGDKEVQYITNILRQMSDNLERSHYRDSASAPD